MYVQLLSVVYCIVKCPFCGNLQGAKYPIKTTECRSCIQKIKLTKIGPIATYDSHTEMQISLRAMKWKGEEKPELTDIYDMKGKEKSKKNDQKGKDNLRRQILELLQSISSRDELLKHLIKADHGIEIIESTLDELISEGLVYSPRYDQLKRT